MAWRVVFGCGDVIAILLPTRAFTSVDLPVLGRPTMATKPDRNSLTRQVSHLKAETNSIASATDVTTSAERSPMSR